MTAHTSRRVLVASGLAIVWFFALMIAIAAMRPEYSHAHKAISELGAFGAPWMLAWNLLGFFGTGLLLAGFALSYRALPGRSAVGFGALMATAVLFCLTAIPIEIGADGDPEMGSAWTSAHLVAVLLVPVPWLYATIRIAFRHRRGDLSALAAVSGVALVAFVVVTVASAARILPESPGLMQRAGFVPFLGWYAAASWTLLTRVPRIDRT